MPALKSCLRQDPGLIELCGLLGRAEQLAMRGAAAQSLACSDPALKRGFAAQQRHEALHATLFQWVIAAVPRAAGPHPRRLALLDAYEARLDRALRRGAVAESVLGLQVVFEGAGAALFQGVTLGWREAPLEPLRCLLAAQEHAHHELGVRALAKLAPGGLEPALERAMREYRAASDDVLASCEPLLRRFSV